MVPSSNQVKAGGIALARFAGYPLWPVRIIETVKTATGSTKYRVFCYGSHDQQLIIDGQLVDYESNKEEASKRITKGVKKAFEELRSFPEIYLDVLKKAKNQSGTNKDGSASSASADVSGLRAQLVASEQEIAQMKENIRKDIQRKVQEKSNERGVGNFPTEIIVSEICDAITVEYTPKFLLLEKSLKGIKHQIDLLKKKVRSLENKLDDFEQEGKLDSLLFHGVKQPATVDINSTMRSVIRKKWAL